MLEMEPKEDVAAGRRRFRQIDSEGFTSTLPSAFDDQDTTLASALPRHPSEIHSHSVADDEFDPADKVRPCDMTMYDFERHFGQSVPSHVVWDVVRRGAVDRGLCRLFFDGIEHERNRQNCNRQKDIHRSILTELKLLPREFSIRLLMENMRLASEKREEVGDTEKDVVARSYLMPPFYFDRGERLLVSPLMDIELQGLLERIQTDRDRGLALQHSISLNEYDKRADRYVSFVDVRIRENKTKLLSMYETMLTVEGLIFTAFSGLILGNGVAFYSLGVCMIATLLMLLIAWISNWVGFERYHWFASHSSFSERLPSTCCLGVYMRDLHQAWAEKRNGVEGCAGWSTQTFHLLDDWVHIPRGAWYTLERYIFSPFALWKNAVGLILCVIGAMVVFILFSHRPGLSLAGTNVTGTAL